MPLCLCVFSGPFNNKTSLVFSLDAFGIIPITHVIYSKKGSEIEVKEIVGGNSIVARLYRYVTLLLNMTPSSHEYKTMGLAAYSNLVITKSLSKFKKIQTINYKLNSLINQRILSLR